MKIVQSMQEHKWDTRLVWYKMWSTERLFYHHC